MRRIHIILIIVLSFISCSISKELGGKSYSYKSKKRTLQLFFDNDSICRLKNTFHCHDIDPEIKEIVITCKYERVKDTIYLRNLDAESNDYENSLTFDIPVQNSRSCAFLNKESRKRKISIGPSYTTEYQKYGLVPRIDIDTLYIQKNKIILYKQAASKSVLFIFK